MHFDVDAIDSTDCPLAHFPHFNTGLSLAEAGECLGQLLTAPGLAAIVVTEVNPDHDPDGLQLRRLVDMLASAMGTAVTGGNKRPSALVDTDVPSA